MCKCCNLFSPNQSELLSHVSEKHRDEGVNADDIIIPLRPLSTPEPSNPSKEGDGKGTDSASRAGDSALNCCEAGSLLCRRREVRVVVQV